MLSETTGSTVSLKYVEGEPIEAGIPLARLEQEKDRIEILLPRPEMVKAKKQHRVLATAILSIFEIAFQEKTHQKQREKFAELLQKLLSKW